jgi:hypothetical protein
LQRPILFSNQADWIEASYGVDRSNVAKLPDTIPQTSGGAPMNPEIAKVPWSKYVDEFTDCQYDMNYKIPNIWRSHIRRYCNLSKRTKR